MKVKHTPRTVLLGQTVTSEKREKPHEERLKSDRELFWKAIATKGGIHIRF